MTGRGCNCIISVMLNNIQLSTRKLANSRGLSYLVVLLIWSGIYLPNLGVAELKGEEGRRVLPAVTMIESGNWMVPSIGGEFYYNKPPLINWMIAASFLITGEQSELTARLPSALAVLCFVTILIWGRRKWLSNSARLICSIVFLTHILMIEQGRLIEIEAVYTCLTAMAMVTWLDARSLSASLLRQWLAPGVILCCAMLTKGPLALIFFLLLVVTVLAYEKRLRDLVGIGPAIMLLIAIVIPLGWGMLASRQADPEMMTGTMTEQMATRFRFTEFEFGHWIENFVKGFLNFMPWLIFVPLLWSKKIILKIDEKHLPLFKACRLVLVIGFLGIQLIPNGSSRYSMPMLPLAVLLVGWVLSVQVHATDNLWRNILLSVFCAASLTAAGGALFYNPSMAATVLTAAGILATVILIQNRNRLTTTLTLSLVTAGVICFITLQYALFSTKLAKANEKRRPVGEAINALVPEGEPLYVFKPGYQAFLFYVRKPLAYCVEHDQVNQDIEYLLVPEEDYQGIQDALKQRNRSWTEVYDFEYRHKGHFYLLKISSDENNLVSRFSGISDAKSFLF